jgi:hypothetical protein
LASIHFLVLALTAGNLIVTELLEHGKTTELNERFPSMNEASAPRILIGSERHRADGRSFDERI